MKIIRQIVRANGYQVSIIGKFIHKQKSITIKNQKLLNTGQNSSK